MNVYYVAIKVGSSGKICVREEVTGEIRKFGHLQAALLEMIQYVDTDWDYWRVIEVPESEPDDYDGTVVAEIRTGRLM